MGALFKASERTAIAELWPTVTPLFPKSQLGESFAASSLGNVVIGEALLRLGETSSVLISLLGANGQASPVRLTSPPTLSACKAL